MPYPGMIGYKAGAKAAVSGAGLSTSPLAAIATPLAGVVEGLMPSQLPKIPKGLRAAGLLRPLPWLGAVMAGYALHRLWNSAPMHGVGAACVTQGSGPTGMFAGGTCLFPFHLAVNHSPPNITNNNFTSLSYGGTTHVCVPNGPWFQQASRRTTKTFSGTTWTAASGAYKPKVYNFDLPFERPERLPGHVPVFNPWHLPIKQPIPNWRTIPWRVLPYRTDPFPNPDPSPSPSPRPRRPPRPFPLPEPEPNVDPVPEEKPKPRTDDPLPRPWPYARPEPEPVEYTRPRPGPKPGRVSPRPRPQPQPRLDPRIRFERVDPVVRPPRPREKEIKIRRTYTALRWALTAVSTTTETKDVLESFWKALPDRFKTKDKGRQGVKPGNKNPPVTTMFNDLYKAIGNMTEAELAEFVNKAIDENVANQIEDYFLGKTGKALGEASAFQNRPIGFASGPAL